MNASWPLGQYITFEFQQLAPPRRAHTKVSVKGFGILYVHEVLHFLHFAQNFMAVWWLSVFLLSMSQEFGVKARTGDTVQAQDHERLDM